jgi:hypothetical protein
MAFLRENHGAPSLRGPPTCKQVAPRGPGVTDRLLPASRVGNFQVACYDSRAQPCPDYKVVTSTDAAQDQPAPAGLAAVEAAMAV